MSRSFAATLLLLLSAVTACDLLLPPPPPVDTGGRGGGGRDNDDDECEEDEDCDGGEFCDRGECQPFAEGEGEEGEGEEGEGEPPPPPPPECNGAGCPEILDFSSNRSTLDEVSSALLSVLVSDPDGTSDIVGGVLLDPTTETTYGTFTATGPGTFQIGVTWDDLSVARSIDFSGGGTPRVVRARFFDNSSNEVFADLTLFLACRDDDNACNGRCGAERCNGACLTEEQLTSDDNCGSCGNACTQSGASCSTESGEPQCLCNGAPCEEPVEGIPYSGSREPGVRCGDQTCPECCFDPFGGTATCTLPGECIFGGTATCDGPEDCNNGEECCFDSFSASCLPTGDCRAAGNREVCVNSNDCAFDEQCCTATLVTAFGGDAGACSVDDPETGGCPAF